MRDLFKYLRGRYVHSMADFARQAKDPWLRYVLENLFLPNVPVWFVAMLLAMLADVDLALLDEPSSDVPWAIAQRYTELGGRITYGGTVERIIVEDNKTLGI